MAQITIPLRPWTIVLIIGGILLSAGIAVTYIKLVLPPDPLIQAARNTSFPILAPLKPPTNMKLDKNSVSTTSQVVSYRYSYDTGKKVIVNAQSTKDGPDFSRFNASKEYQSSAGKVYLVELEDRTTAAVVGSKSWLLINIPGGGDTAKMRDFIDSLRPLSAN